MILVREKIPDPSSGVRRVAVRAPRHQIAKRRWRASAEDGTDFGFDLAEPLQHGDCIHVAGQVAYFIEQEPEKVLIIEFPADSQNLAALAWNLGNLHAPMEVSPEGMILEENQAVRKWLAAFGAVYHEGQRIFRPLKSGSSHDHFHTTIPVLRTGSA